VVVAYDRAFWREAGHSGNAFVTHEQAVVGEIFDACDGDAARAALGGFLAFPPELRSSFSEGLPLLMDSQMSQVFGAALGDGEQHYQDWAMESYTCSALDRTSARTEHADVANPMLRRTHWNGKLYLGGSETASRGAGYLEGALEAARRIGASLNRISAQQEASVSQSRAGGDDATSINAASLARFGAWVAAQGDTIFDSYRHRLNRGLATQQREQLTQRAILESMEEVFDKALELLDDLDFDVDEVTVERGRSSLTPGIQQPFGDLMQSVLDDVVAFNRTSCALSNFPDEHHLSKGYHQVILRDIAAAWLEFSLAANRLLLAKADAHDRRRKPVELTVVSP
jgi:monoamine oxidase